MGIENINHVERFLIKNLWIVGPIHPLVLLSTPRQGATWRSIWRKFPRPKQQTGFIERYRSRFSNPHPDTCFRIKTKCIASYASLLLTFAGIPIAPNLFSSHRLSPSPPLDNIRVMMIVWRLRGNIIRTAQCWIVWHNVHSQQHSYMSSSYRSNRLGLSHWDPYAVRRGGCLELYYCNTVEWFWWDSNLISRTNWFPSVLWHC